MKELLILLIPFIGTCLGSLMIFIIKGNLNKFLEKGLIGIAAGIMVAAAIWSLIIPALDRGIIKVVVGMILGVGIFYLLDLFLLNKYKVDKTMLAISLHNIPEGMAVGVVIANMMLGDGIFSTTLALAMGIAIQNFPEGFIVSFPLLKNGCSKRKALFWGIFSAILELLGGLVTILFTNFIISLLPYLLAIAAGAMFYVVIEELLPEARDDNKGDVIFFTMGFLLMMILDVVLS